jgi:hypothetical protein
MSGKLIPFAKLSDDAVRRIVRGFCCAESIADLAAATGISPKTCRSVVLALRPRLLEQPFDIWREALLWRFPINPELALIAQATVFGCLAKCYFNRTCFTNHQQGRRQSRLCRSCLIPVLEMGEDHTAAALYQIDLIHGFYAVLGIGAEPGKGELTLFRLRLTHMQVVGEAIEATRRRADGTPDPAQPGLRTVKSLFEQLIRDLERKPLDRQTPEADPMFAPFEDLTFLR